VTAPSNDNRILQRSGSAADYEQPFDALESLAGIFEGTLLPASEGLFGPQGYHNGTFASRDILYFGTDLDLELDFTDYQFINSLQDDLQASNNVIGSLGVSPVSTVAGAAEAFKRSFWCWTPMHQDQAFAEAGSLSTQVPEGQLQTTPSNLSATVGQSVRDELIIMIMHAFQSSGSKKPSVSSFPSAKVLSNLLELFLVRQTVGIDRWVYADVHLFELPKTIPMAAFIASGAVQSSLRAVHKFGFALQEALRISVSPFYDNDNTLSRNLGMIQAEVLGIQMGLWSGQKRKMEIAESNFQPPVTMLRRAGKFRSGQYPPISLDATDQEGETSRWHQWIRQESFKRLAIHVFLHDAQASMALMINPLISEAEMQFPLPAAYDIWSAKTSSEWEYRYMNTGCTVKPTIPSIADCIHDISNLTSVGDSIDFPLSALAVLHGYWRLVWSYRQLASLHNCSTTGETSTSLLMPEARQSELSQMLKRFRKCVLGRLQDSSRHTLGMIQELLNMYLHVSMEELQIFAGKEGVDDSRHILPRLHAWTQDRNSKQSIWSAGQVLRSAKRFAPGSLRDFYAIAVYHASLTLWSYSVIHRAHKRSAGQDLSVLDINETFALDGPESKKSDRFLLFGHGTPFISSVDYPAESGFVSLPAVSALITDPTAVMRVSLQILESNFRTRNEQEPTNVPPLVENLVTLMRDLSVAVDFECT
jgi:hypothetical protein